MTVEYLILVVFLGGVMLGVVAMVGVAVRREDRRFSLSGAAPGAAESGARWLTVSVVQAQSTALAARRGEERFGRSHRESLLCHRNHRDHYTDHRRDLRSVPSKTSVRPDMLAVRADYRLKDRGSHLDGDDCPVQEVLQLEAAQRARIDQDRACVSRKHYRLPRWIARYVLVFDFCLLLYFFAGITDVRWASPVSQALALAIGLAAMLTLLSYGFLAFTGHRLRSHRNQAVFVIALYVIAAMLVLLRIRDEIVDALRVLAQITALVIDAAVAVVSAADNFLVITVPAFDGSDQTARLDKLSATARRPVNRARRGLSGRSVRQKPWRTTLMRWLAGAPGAC